MVFGRRIEVTRLLGVALLGLAVLAAAGTLRGTGAAPTPRGSSSAARPAPTGAIPRPEAPIGTIEGELPAFSWAFDGAEPDAGFEVLLFDEEFAELGRTLPIHGDHVDLAASGLSERLAIGVRAQWCVQVAGRPETRSAPMPLRRR